MSQTTKNILVIVAHPDDIEFGNGGAVARWTSEGHHVTYCIVTNGAAGSNKPGEDLTQLVETRRREQTEAAACVGVTDVRFLGYQDGALEPTMALRRDLTRLIREVKADRVLLMDPTTILIEDERDGDYINHPDHRASGEAALYAVFPSAETRPIFPELLDEGYEPHHVEEVWMMIATKPNRYVDVSQFIEQKIAALLCHKSQVDERVVPMVRGWSAQNGRVIGTAYAEAYRVFRFPVDEPEADTAGTATT